MNLDHIKSESDVDQFLSVSLPDYYRYHTTRRRLSETLVALIVDSASLNDFLRTKIFESEDWCNLVVFDCDESARQHAAYPRELRLYFCPVKNRAWPHLNDNARQDCSSLLATATTIDSGQDLHCLHHLFLHNWFMRASAPEPFFWYQDVAFADENLLLAFCARLLEQEAFTGSIFMAPFDKRANLHVRFLFLPWKFAFPHVETGRRKFFNRKRKKAR